MGVAATATSVPEHGSQLALDRLVAWSAEIWFQGLGWLATIGITLLTLLALRAAVIGVLAVRHHRRGATPLPGPMPQITVLVPAFNEAGVVGRTIDSLRAQVDAQGLPLAAEILVIDDGSSDHTAAVAEGEGVRVIRQDNAGKWAALNRGLMAATGEVVVAIDADTVLDAHSVELLCRWFADPQIGAMSGTAKVGNRHTLVTLWQHIEYVTGFNIDRRAYCDMNAITVVPGAIGAWRRSAVIPLGGYSGRTLAEDCDLTIAVVRAGWRVGYEPAAVAWTEAPETMRGLAKQRLRWAFGTLQAMWLHRGALLRRREGALGMIALPFAWLYQVVMSPLAPVIDVIVAVAVLTGGWTTALWWYGATTAIEMAVAWLAFRMEGEPAWPVLALPLQRFCYRQLMYWVVVRALVRALRGQIMGWGKLVRTGNVRITTPRGSR